MNALAMIAQCGLHQVAPAEPVASRRVEAPDSGLALSPPEPTPDDYHPLSSASDWGE